MSLKDSLSPVQAGDARRSRPAHPDGSEITYDRATGEANEVTINALTEIPQDEKQWRDAITRATGLTVPDERRVVLSQVRTWGDPHAPFIYCRFLIEDRPEATQAVDGVEILKALRPRKQVKTAFTGETTLGTVWCDWQAGKNVGGGTEALAERLDTAFDGLRDRARELRKIGRDLGQLLIVGAGDMVEGCAIFPNQPHELDSDRRTQIRNTVTFGLDGLDRLAPLFERVTVLAVGGNHGENRIGGHRTTRHDNDDCAVFEHMAVAASRDPRLSHVNFVIAQDEPAKTVDVNGWIVGATHGQVFGKNATGSIEQKAWRWFANQAAGRQPIGDADLLLTAHYHHYAARDWGSCLWVQSPAMDGGSPFFTDFSGQASDPGMLSWVTSPEKRFVDPQIL